MKKKMVGLLSIILFPLFLFVGCEDDECKDCGGGISKGYYFKQVTEGDLATLGAIEGIELDICITYSVIDLVSEKIDTETVGIVDDCCCD